MNKERVKRLMNRGLREIAKEPLTTKEKKMVRDWLNKLFLGSKKADPRNIAFLHLAAHIIKFQTFNSSDAFNEDEMLEVVGAIVKHIRLSDV